MQPHDPRYKKERKKKKKKKNLNSWYHEQLLLPNSMRFPTQRVELRDLLDCNRLSQVSWEVDVQVPKNSKPVGDKL